MFILNQRCYITLEKIYIIHTFLIANNCFLFDKSPVKRAAVILHY